MSIDPLRPHLPDLDASPLDLALREIADRDEQIAQQHAELMEGRRQLDLMREAVEHWRRKASERLFMADADGNLVEIVRETRP